MENVITEYAVVGRQFYVGYRMPLVIVRDDPEADTYNPSTRYALWYARSGSAFIEWGGDPQMIVAPVVVLLRAGQSLVIRNSLDLKTDTIYFLPTMINDAFTLEALEAQSTFQGTTHDDYYLIRPFDSLQCADKIRYLRPSTQERVEGLMAQIEFESHAQADNNWPCRIRSFLIEMLTYINMSGAESPAGPVVPIHDLKLDDLMLYIHDHYASNLAIQDLAKRFGTNRTSLNALFQGAVGTSIHRYIMSLRIHMACTLLRDTRLPIGEIMFRIGYENPSHFSRIFKRMMGMVPSEYRAEQCWV